MPLAHIHLVDGDLPEVPQRRPAVLAFEIPLDDLRREIPGPTGPADVEVE
jgi:hypothetical protein